jgi:hypothetical protein
VSLEEDGGNLGTVGWAVDADFVLDRKVLIGNTWWDGGGKEGKSNCRKRAVDLISFC